ncbi:MAG: hypothetical protein A2857_02310 [Candidatus Levybacteria bacterium RIFCSPHIGHO2_01_FULL_36_15]|nr:MAG: hypothetical protein A2857_02310 [Candidatus Levybacteria bacterium RIFCSPHIGHO2_01_FULL_36_15]
MVKIGPSFSDFVIQGKASRRKRISSSLGNSMRDFFPVFVLLTLFLIIFFKLFYLQVVRAAYYKNLSDGNRIRTKVTRAERGIIFDRNAKALVRNLPAFRILDKDKVIFIDNKQALSLIAQGKADTLEADVQREYLYKDIFSHVLGYTGQISQDELMMPEFKTYNPGDFVGKTGIEEEYEQLLKGEDGKELYEMDAKGKTIRFLGKQEAVPGRDIYTTLDLNLQLSVFNALENISKGAVVVSDPNNGAILAIVSKPSYDPNLFTHAQNYTAGSEYKTISSVLLDTDNQPMLDRAISGVYPPGSTFKIIVSAAALELKAINKDTKFEDTGVLRVGNFSFGNWYYSSYGRTEGYLDVIGAIKRSNDIFFYKTAETIGVDKIAGFAKKFGLGAKLGIDVPGETKGVIPTTSWKKEIIGDQWYLGDTYHFGIGQGYLLTTPLQVNSWASVFANGGTLFKPHILNGKDRILNSNFIKRENINLIREGMKQSCSTGGVAWPFFEFKIQNSKFKIDGEDYTEVSSGSAKLVKIQVGCKTGTAETSEDKDPHAWITVFAPFKKPEIVVTVLVENGGEGSNVAAPIAKKILEDYFSKK